VEEFDVSTETVDGVCVVRVTGELDISTHERLGETLTEAAAKDDPIVVDLSACDFIDSSGVRALLLGLKATEASSNGAGGFAIAGPSSQVVRIIEMTGLDKAVPVHPSVDAALKAFS
jgi:anti-sigma B factor antagonist